MTNPLTAPPLYSPITRKGDLLNFDWTRWMDGFYSSVSGSISVGAGLIPFGSTAPAPLGVSANFSYDSLNAILGVGTGMTVGATGAKLAIYGAAPVVQRPTSGSSAVRVAGVGTGVLVDDTFDGYTVARLVKALREFGLLA